MEVCPLLADGAVPRLGVLLQLSEPTAYFLMSALAVVPSVPPKINAVGALAMDRNETE